MRLTTFKQQGRTKVPDVLSFCPHPIPAFLANKCRRVFSMKAINVQSTKRFKRSFRFFPACLFLKVCLHFQSQFKVVPTFRQILPLQKLTAPSLSGLLLKLVPFQSSSIFRSTPIPLFHVHSNSLVARYKTNETLFK